MYCSQFFKLSSVIFHGEAKSIISSAFDKETSPDWTIDDFISFLSFEANLWVFEIIWNLNFLLKKNEELYEGIVDPRVGVAARPGGGEIGVLLLGVEA